MAATVMLLLPRQWVAALAAALLAVVFSLVYRFYERPRVLQQGKKTRGTS
jgi:hypothetical protein